MKQTGAISLTAIVIALISLCLSVCALKAQESTLSILVGILAILVTTLVGWQIFTLIDISKRSKELSILVDEAALNNEKNIALTENAVADVYYYLLLKEPPLDCEYYILYHYMCCLVHTSNFKDFEACNAIVKAILDMTSGTKIELRESLRANLIHLLYKIRTPEKINGYKELLTNIVGIHTCQSKEKTLPN